MSEEKIKILLVDDDESIRSTYAEIFRGNGLDVIEANNGLEGLEAAKSQAPSVIMSGIIMPEMDGFTLKEKLDEDEKTAKIPFMIFSHRGRQEDREKADKLGIKDFLVLGMITPLEIVEKIKKEFKSGGYVLRLDGTILDAEKISADLGLSPGMKCPNCQGDMNISLKPTDSGKRDFLAKLFCPNCEK
jgi:CheY-like chemotaxis protein